MQFFNDEDYASIRFAIPGLVTKCRDWTSVLNRIAENRWVYKRSGCVRWRARGRENRANARSWYESGACTRIVIGNFYFFEQLKESSDDIFM